MSCSECDAAGKYKCPTCYAKYCSVACCKLHKEKSCTAQKKTEEVRKSPSEELILKADQWEGPEETEDYVSQDRLAELGNSEEVKQLLRNPHLRGMMEDLVASSNPARDMETAMYEPIFVELADACLRVVEGDKDPDL